MYESFLRSFGLARDPFHVSPDPRFLYRSPSVCEALAQLVHGVESHRGFALLTGDVGTGKTTVLRELLGYLHARNAPVCFVYNSHLELHDLFDFMLAEFRILCGSLNKMDVLAALNHWLVEQFRQRKTPVLIVDEAQGLPLRVLEEIRLLLNLETPQEKLLQIILCGTPELEESLKRPELRQLRQRISAQFRLEPLSAQETSAYIAERLRLAGASRTDIFSAGAAAEVYVRSGGIPRVINLLCEHGLIAAYAVGSRSVGPEMIREVACEFQLENGDGGTAPAPAQVIAVQRESAATSVEKILEQSLSEVSTVLPPATAASRAAAAGAGSNPSDAPSPLEALPGGVEEHPRAQAMSQPWAGHAPKLVAFRPPPQAAAQEFLQQLARGGERAETAVLAPATASVVHPIRLVTEHTLKIPAAPAPAAPLRRREWHVAGSHSAKRMCALAKGATAAVVVSGKRCISQGARTEPRVQGLEQAVSVAVRRVRHWMRQPVQWSAAALAAAQAAPHDGASGWRERFVVPVLRWLGQPIRPS